MGVVAKFSCAACQRTYTWKPELAGKRVKCKCGQPVTVPVQTSAAPAPSEGDDDLYALAADAERAAAVQPVRVVTTPAPTAASPTAPAAKPAGLSAAAMAYPKPRGSTLAYASRGGDADSHLDATRDLYAPLVFMLIGVILFISYYAVNHSASGPGIASFTIRLTILNFIEASVLFGFALVIAGPLGVSFGDIRTAFTKLAAIALFCDGVTTWVDAGVARMAGGLGSGILGFGFIGFPVALGIYWMLMIYLFSMDPGDSYMVVIILSVFYRVLRIILIVLLLELVLGLGGTHALNAARPVPTGPMADEVNDAKDRNLLREARKYIADGHQAALTDTVNKWYALGCPNVWFEVSRDINGKGSAYQVIVELPDKPILRTKCYDNLKAYYDSNHMDYSPEELKDNGDPYLLFPVG